ncbi:MAG TPA: aspartate/glutamate racemase family protein [Bacillota bacterium]|nr:aspartate/glutamate racemase family protein [Bacillota bacterium]HNT04494.1 aspartate/glutamate racemase family protein [Bacillota bacterium]HPA54285.1 aspartate/glutamate racemase family protein [Bacillota bacterium]HPX68909.1 aspartate/glutamate racemase family protein [Bacillota bacterium]HQA66608.1 aspartate/glutamate racemase family protein [Bacillota bacterium]
MKTIGIIGGVSWESTVEYYRILNETVNKKLGGLHSAKCLIYSVEFQEITDLMQTGDWKAISVRMQEIASILKSGGADFLIICSNTLAAPAPEIEKNIGMPVHSIAEATAKEILGMKLKKIGLLGTKYTMEGDYYRNTLYKYGIETVVPEKEDREAINSIIFDELCLGILKESSKEIFRNIISKLQSKGAEGIVLGCTEIPLLVKQEDVSIPVFDTLTIHAVSAAELALG